MTAALAGAPIGPGFADPVHDAQAAFRAVLDAMARPGLIVEPPPPASVPEGLVPAMAAVLLALADHETPVWLDASASTDAARAWLRFHCGAPIAATPADTRFAAVAGADAMPALDRFALGTDPYPDRSATVIIAVTALGQGGRTVRLAGPGIETETALAVAGLPERFWTEWSANRALFPCGIDVVLVEGGRLAALPRTARVLE